MAAIKPEPCPDHPDLAPREVPVGGTVSHQSSHITRVITEWRCADPRCPNY